MNNYFKKFTKSPEEVGATVLDGILFVGVVFTIMLIGGAL